MKDIFLNKIISFAISGFIDLMEFFRLPLGEMKLYLHKLGQENPFVQSRNSNQTWLWHYGAYSELLESFHERSITFKSFPINS